ncbi:hypothetical protein, partial [Salmonella enterica]|uniref:hypothetical protein n=1 Tax=Salmonella enterica TaxID=28901 RepID=UPI003D287ECA
DIEVSVVDIIESEPLEYFDYVLMSGVFNTNVGQDLKWIKTFVTKMYNLCTNHIAFNAISTFVNHKDQNMFYVDPLEITKFCIE